MQLPEWFNNIGAATLWGAIGALVGWVADRFVVARLAKVSHDREKRSLAAFLTALRGMPVVWGALAGVALARSTVETAPQVMLWLERGWRVLAILSVTVFLSRLVTNLIQAYAVESGSLSSTIFENIGRAAVWSVGIIFALAALGVQVSPLLATLGVTGIALSLGLQDTLANLFGGLQITLAGLIQPGQFIRLQSGEEGEVMDVTWRHTRMRTPKNELIIVPNSVLSSSLFTNYSLGSTEFGVVVPFGLEKSEDLQRAMAVALEVASHVQQTLPEAVQGFEPKTSVTGFEMGGPRCTAALRARRYQDRFAVADAFTRALSERFAAEGIELAKTRPA